MSEHKDLPWLLGLLLLGAAGCASSISGTPAPQATPPSADAPTHSVTPSTSAQAKLPALPPWSPEEGLGAYSYGKQYWINVLPPEQGFPLNEEFDLTLRILDGATRTRVSPLRPMVDARMPAHGHGMKQKPVLELESDGSWRVRGLLWHMVGRWELHIDLEDGALTERTQFEYEME